MPHPNALLPCGTESARRRHAAHGQQCRTCDRGTPPTLASLLADNQRLTARLTDADRVMGDLLRFPVIRHEALDRARRRLFPTPQKGAAA